MSYFYWRDVIAKPGIVDPIKIIAYILYIA